MASTYLEKYIETVDSVPLELQRCISLIREHDSYSRGILESISKKVESLISKNSENCSQNSGETAAETNKPSETPDFSVALETIYQEFMDYFQFSLAKSEISKQTLQYSQESLHSLEESFQRYQADENDEEEDPAIEIRRMYAEQIEKAAQLEAEQEFCEYQNDTSNFFPVETFSHSEDKKENTEWHPNSADHILVRPLETSAPSASLHPQAIKKKKVKGGNQGGGEGKSVKSAVNSSVTTSLQGGATKGTSKRKGNSNADGKFENESKRQKTIHSSSQKSSLVSASSAAVAADASSSHRVEESEPTYCICNQVSYGEMIGCDNSECPTEWFHFHCVGLTSKPKGKWFCPNCVVDSKKKDSWKK